MEFVYLFILLLSSLLLLSNIINENVSIITFYKKIPVYVKVIPILYFVITPYMNIPSMSTKYSKYISSDKMKLIDDEITLLQSSKVIHNVIKNNKGIEIFTRRYPVKNMKSKGNVLMIHGFSWHSYYFQSLSLELQANGFNVISYDQCGCGRSGTIDGFKGHVANVEDLIDETNVVLDFYLKNETNQKLFIFAESMGATITIKGLTTHTLKNVNGVVFSGPVVKVADHLLPPPPALFFIKTMAYFFPKLPVPSENPANTFHEAFGDQEFANMALKDCLVNFNAPTFALAKTILTTISDNLELLHNINIPVLILHGDIDKRTDYKNSIMLNEKISSKDKTLIIVKGGSHQLLQDTKIITNDVKNSIKSWLLKH